MSKIKNILIIGGVAGGASAATRARRCDADARITIIERGQNASFANCGLPYHLGGEIPKRESLIVASKELFKNRFNIEIRTLTEAVKIDPNNKTVKVVSLDDGKEEDLAYDKLIISTGSRLRRLPVLEGGYENVFSLWSLNDLDSSMSFLTGQNLKSAVVIGSGFVGLEIVEQLKRRELNVTLIEKLPQVLAPIDPEIASFIEDELKENGIKLHLGVEVQSVKTNAKIIDTLVLDDGTEIPCDIVFFGVGVVPESTLAKDAGIQLGANGGISVNEFQQTNLPDIYAVGDVSEYSYAPLNSQSLVPLAGPANRSGRNAGEHSVTGKIQFTQRVQGTSIVRVFEKNVALTGLSEKQCRSFGLEYEVSFITAKNHASYFPNSTDLIIKTLFSGEDGRILGAQILGEEGVDKRIDIISTLINFKGKASDLAGLDLAYAPPFGSAKDPLHIVAFTILNSLENKPTLLHPGTDLSSFQVIDVRSKMEIENIPLDNALHLPIDSPEEIYTKELSKLDRKIKTVIVCHSGKRAHVVASKLCNLGFSEVYNLTGGMMIRSRILK